MTFIKDVQKLFRENIRELRNVYRLHRYYFVLHHHDKRSLSFPEKHRQSGECYQLYRSIGGRYDPGHCHPAYRSIRRFSRRIPRRNCGNCNEISGNYLCI